MLDYIDEHSPQGAERVKARLKAIIALLAKHPRIGRLTTKRDIRRIVASPYPYLVFYRATDTEVVIYAIRHAARRPAFSRR